MNRWEFMRQLEMLLSDISPSEREEALQYYNDYFNDAGTENERQVIKALGSPAQVARIVKDGLSDNPGMGEFTENGYTNQGTVTSNAIMKRSGQAQGQNSSTQGNTANAKYENASYRNAENRNSGAGNENQNGNQYTSSDGQSAGGSKGSGKKEDFPVWAIVLIVIGCIICSPAIVGIAGALLGVIASIFITVFALVFGFGLAALILLIVAISLVAGGFGCVFSSPITAMGLVGGGLICLSLGTLFLLLTVFLAGKLIPAVCQGIAYIFRKLFGKKEAEA